MPNRLLIFSSEFPPGPGGIGTHAYQVSHKLQRIGWEVLALSSQNYASEVAINAFNKQQPFSVKRLRSIYVSPVEAVYRMSVLMYWLKRWKPAIVLATGSRAVWIVSYVSKVFNFPLIAVGHGGEFAFSRDWERKLTKWAYSQANATICVSKYTRQRMWDLGIKTSLDIVIPNGADLSHFKLLDKSRILEYRRHLGIDDAFVLLTVGNVTRRKGQDIVIRALPYMLSKCPGIEYLIVGLPTRKSQLLELANELNVRQHVHFLGRLDMNDLVLAYNVADIFVMVSRHTPEGDFEGYGIVVVEAALCGKPAVVAKGAGLEESIIPKQTGLLVPENDPDKTGQAIVSLLKDGDRRLEMGRSARERALREQTWAHRVKDYHQLLLKILEEDV